MNRPNFPRSAVARGVELPESAAPTGDRTHVPRLSPGQLRMVHRAATDLRRGIPVVLAADPPLVLLAAEAASAAGLEEYCQLVGAPPVLLLAPTRAAAVLRRPVGPAGGMPVALALTAPLLAPEPLARLADPTLEQTLPAVPEPVEAPAAAGAALALVKLGRLLPAVVAAPLRGMPSAPEAGVLAVSPADVLAYRPAAASSLRRLTEAQVPLSAASDARIVIFRPADGGIEHLAILVGEPRSEEAPLVRLHSECFTGDLLDSLRCDCGAQLRGAIARMAEAGAGVLLYLAQEGRGIGLASKLRAYTLQDRGLDTVDANRALGWEADERNFLTAATMLEALGIRRVRLLTNNPDKLSGLAACGIEVAGREPHAFAPNGVNDEYLATKARRFGHLLG
ncbi:MAG: GTP cyclohydrolase II [Rhodospirillales bacterium]|nr:GTP cyclohydrolase II [Rhodospirillales bacterium]